MRSSAALAILALLAVAGCGGDSDTVSVAPTTGGAAATERVPTTETPSGSAPTPGVPLSNGGDNSVQTFGGEAGAGEATAATKALEAYLVDRAAGRWTSACARLTDRISSELRSFGRPPTCEQGMRALTDSVPQADLDAAAEVHFLSLRRQGGRAFLIYRDGDGLASQIAMQPRGDGWAVAALIGAPLLVEEP